MKTKDTLLLEQAYEEVLLDEKINWKGALTAAAMAALQLIGTGNAKAADTSAPVTGIEQTKNTTAEDLLPQKEFEQVLQMMRDSVAKGDLKSAKQILNIVRQECTNATAKVSGSNEIHKIAKMHAQAEKIFNDAYLGVVKSGINSMIQGTK
jgi:hypothetical protein